MSRAAPAAAGDAAALATAVLAGVRAGVRALPPLREVIARQRLDADKGLGQHFLLDLNLTGRIARAAGDLTAGSVLEVGPGPGGLTRALLLAGARYLVAIERDPGCVTALADLAAVAEGRLDVRQGDALKLDLSSLCGPPRRIIANLPYNIGTKLLLGWLEQMAAFSQMVLMFQREVADRITARPGSRAYGRLTVIVQSHAVAERLFDVPARAFTPPPRVVSAVVRLTPLPEPPDVAFSLIGAVTAAAFGQRRKMLRSSLASLGVDVPGLLAAAGLPQQARAGEIPVAGFLRLARAYGALCGAAPGKPASAN